MRWTSITTDNRKEDARISGHTLLVPIYEYRCEECGKRSSALLKSFSSPDPVCPHCGKTGLRRLVSTFATVHSDDDGGGAGGDDFGGDSDSGGGDFGDGDDGGGGFDGGDDF
jgi:putative FmdB family regulatory protein